MDLRNHLDVLEQSGFSYVDFNKQFSICDEYDYLANFELNPGIYIIANEDGNARIVALKKFDMIQIDIDVGNFIAYKKIGELQQ